MTTATKTLPGMTAEQEHEHAALLGRIEEQREQVPCVDGPNAGDWVTDEKHTQATAARACRACPLLVPCRAYAIRHAETGGVWGGLLPAQITAQARHYRAALDEDRRP